MCCCLAALSCVTLIRLHEPITVFNTRLSADLLAADCVVFNDYKTLEISIPFLYWRREDTFIVSHFVEHYVGGKVLISDPPPSVSNNSLCCLNYYLQLMSRPQLDLS